MKNNRPKQFEINYVSSFDGTQIYYETYGIGDITLVPCNGLGVSTFFWKHLVHYFGQTCRVILWDYRSHGKSGQAPDLHDLTLENNARDLLAVLNANRVGKAVLLGHSMGVQTIFEFYRQFPERVAALVPVLGSYGSPISTFMNTDKFSYAFPVVHRMVFMFPDIFNSLVNSIISSPVAFPGARLVGLVNWQHCKQTELQPYLDHLKKLDLRVFFGMGYHMQRNNARHLLPHIDVPTLIIAGEDDIFTPYWISEEMARIIPNAELLTIPHGSHAAIIEQPELINLRIEKFLRDRIDSLARATTAPAATKKRKSTPPAKKIAKKTATRSKRKLVTTE